MIISDKYKFCFIHIPKCAGTSVRKILMKYDDNYGKFSDVENSSKFGVLDLGHIPLKTLELQFFKEYEKVKNYYSVAIVRDPFTRFPSSISQWLKSYNDKPIQELSFIELKNQIEICIESLVKVREIYLLPAELIHFQRQSNYIFNDGEKLIDKIYTTEQVSQLLIDLQSLIGEQIFDTTKDEFIHANKTMVYRSQFIKIPYKFFKPLLTKMLKPIIPDKLEVYLRNLIYVERSQRLEELYESTSVRDFINDYYSEDICIFNKVTSGSQ